MWAGIAARSSPARHRASEGARERQVVAPDHDRPRLDGALDGALDGRGVVRAHAAVRHWRALPIVLVESPRIGTIGVGEMTLSPIRAGNRSLAFACGQHALARGVVLAGMPDHADSIARHARGAACARCGAAGDVLHCASAGNGTASTIGAFRRSWPMQGSRGFTDGSVAETSSDLMLNHLDFLQSQATRTHDDL